MEAFFADANITVFVQLVVAMALGMLLGVERTLAGKEAGMRTYALVSTGAALFIVATTLGAPSIAVFGDADPLRIAAGIITGIGFLGAGVIIFRRNEGELEGLTTAAGLWIAAGIGIAVGYQLYATALFVTLLTLFIFTILWYVEHYIEERTTQPDERVRVVKKEKQN